MPLPDHFDILAPLYETFIHPRVPQDLWRLAELPVDGKLLDAGGGTGRISQYMVGKATSVFVADVSIKMLAETSHKDGLIPVGSHTEKLPFPDNTFSRIIMVDALHHVCDQEMTLVELMRVLQPGGKLVVEEPDIHSFPVKLIALAEKLAFMRSHFLSAERIAALLKTIAASVRSETGKHTVWVIAEKL